MAATISQSEDVPASYPDTSALGLSAEAAALDPAAVWQRLESWVAHRWTARGVVWTVEGAGDWTPPLTPATVTATEQWEAGAWAAVTLPAGPYGYELPGEGPYRITATVGGGTAPAAVLEAFRRLAEYLAGGRSTVDEPGAARYGVKIGDSLEFDVERNPAWVARAMQNSGAADLLRPYRRAN